METIKHICIAGDNQESDGLVIVEFSAAMCVFVIALSSVFLCLRYAAVTDLERKRQMRAEEICNMAAEISRSGITDLSKEQGRRDINTLLTGKCDLTDGACAVALQRADLRGLYRLTVHVIWKGRNNAQKQLKREFLIFRKDLP